MLFVIFASLLVVNCTNKSVIPAAVVTGQTTLPHPAKEILINNGRYNRPYIRLGQVEYTLKRYISVFDNKIKLRAEAIDILKQEALTKYGDKVDAIIDTTVQESVEEGYINTLSVTHIQGIAISFIAEEKTPLSHTTKRKAKASKTKLHKAMPSRNKLHNTKSQDNTFRKNNSEEINITPSEILK